MAVALAGPDDPNNFNNWANELFGYPFQSDDDDPTLDEVFDDGFADEDYDREANIHVNPDDNRW